VTARRRLGSALLLLLLAGCARVLAPPRQPVAEDARAAVALLLDRWHEFSDLRTLLDVRLTRGRERQTLSGVLLTRAPASLRFEALAPFGQPLLLVVMHAGQLTAYNAATNRATVGPATADTAARLLGLAFDPDDLVGALAGRPLPPKDLRVAELVPADEHGPSVLMVGSDHSKRVWMDLVTGVVSQMEVTGGRYEVRIAYRRARDGSLAGFDLSAAAGSLTADAQYRQPVFDGGIDPERFELAVPESAKIERLR
jgi:outer membrane lipoprotein-sorting protein